MIDYILLLNDAFTFVLFDACVNYFVIKFYIKR